MLRVDSIDQRIIAQLVANARASYAEIGKVVGLSAPAVKRRVDRLLETGVLRGFTAVVNPEALGWGTEAFVEVHCRGNVTPDRIRARLEPLARDTSPFAGRQPPRETRFVEPVLVAAVDYGEWTQSRTLRHPVYQGLREDVDPADVGFDAEPG